MALSSTGRPWAALIPLSISDSTKSITGSPRTPASRTMTSETVTVTCMVGLPSSGSSPNPRAGTDPTLRESSRTTRLQFARRPETQRNAKQACPAVLNGWSFAGDEDSHEAVPGVEDDVGADGAEVLKEA